MTCAPHSAPSLSERPSCLDSFGPHPFYPACRLTSAADCALAAGSCNSGMLAIIFIPCSLISFLIYLLLATHQGLQLRCDINIPSLSENFCSSRAICTPASLLPFPHPSYADAAQEFPLGRGCALAKQRDHESVCI